MINRSRTPRFMSDVAVEALGGAIAAIAIGWLGQIPALVGLVGGAVLTSRVEAILGRRRGPFPPSPEAQPASPGPPRALTPAPDTTSGPRASKRLFTRSSLLTVGIAVLTVLVSFTLIEVVRGASLIGNRDTTFFDETVSVRVPLVTGLREDDARRKLSALGFGVELGGQKFSAFDRGLVGSMSPAPGTNADKGSVVTLWISLGGVEVPNLVGVSVDQAKAELEARGLVPGEVLPEFNEEVPADGVIRTDPEGGQLVAEDSIVTIVVSRGPGVEVPDLVGMSIAEATAELEARGLVLSEVSPEFSDQPVDVVIRTDPEGGQVVEAGTAFSITVSAGPPSPSP